MATGRGLGRSRVLGLVVSPAPKSKFLPNTVDQIFDGNTTCIWCSEVVQRAKGIIGRCIAHKPAFVNHFTVIAQHSKSLSFTALQSPDLFITGGARPANADAGLHAAIAQMITVDDPCVRRNVLFQWDSFDSPTNRLSVSRLK
jgi:hypothetical protein